MKRVVQGVKSAVRAVMHEVAVVLNRISGGRLSPDAVTIFGFLMHIPNRLAHRYQASVVGSTPTRYIWTI